MFKKWKLLFLFLLLYTLKNEIWIIHAKAWVSLDLVLSGLYLEFSVLRYRYRLQCQPANAIEHESKEEDTYALLSNSVKQRQQSFMTGSGVNPSTKGPGKGQQQIHSR